MATGDTGRGAAVIRWRNWSLTTKLAAVVLVPVIFAITLGVGQIRWQVDRADEYDRVAKVLDAVDQIEPLVVSVQEERTRSVDFLTGSIDAGKVDEQAVVVDAAVRGTRQVMASPEDYSDVVRERFGELNTELGKLDETRALVRDRRAPAPAVIERYSKLVNSILSLNRALTSTVADRNLSSTASAMQDMVSIMEEVRLQQAWVLTGLAEGSISPQALDQLLGSRARLIGKISEARATVAAHWQRRLDQTMTGTAILERNKLATAIVLETTDGKFSGGYSVPRDQWNQRSDEVIQLIDEGHDDLGAEVRRIAFDLEDDASSAAGWDSVLLLSALILAAAIIITIARQLLGSLRDLRRGALKSANKGLPEAVTSIRAGRKVDSELEPVGVDTDEEVGQVARAFDEVNRQALRLAVEQASLRRGYSEAFVSVSRRSQALLERQLRLFEELEKDEEDPDQLSRLFQLDHLATRMRRNNENLMVLSGSDLARRFYQPTELADVLRAAVSEIEQYPRVIVQPPPAVKLVGHAASDMVRLVAELLDNAANFSSPDTSVTVSSYQSGDGSVVLDVLDEGIGMGHAELASANERLARVDEDDLATSRRMGLFVAGRLAVRHDIGVELHGGPDVEGVRATVTIPAEHVVAGDAGRTAPPPPGQGVHRNGSTQHDLPNATSIPAQPAGDDQGFPAADFDPSPSLPRRGVSEPTARAEFESSAPLPRRDPSGGLNALDSGSPLPRREPREPSLQQDHGAPATEGDLSGPAPLFEPSQPSEAAEEQSESYGAAQQIPPEQPAEQTVNLFTPEPGGTSLDIPHQPRTVGQDFAPAWPAVTEEPPRDQVADTSESPIFEEVSTQWFQPATDDAQAHATSGTAEHEFAWPDSGQRDRSEVEVDELGLPVGPGAADGLARSDQPRSPGRWEDAGQSPAPSGWSEVGEHRSPSGWDDADLARSSGDDADGARSSGGWGESRDPEDWSRSDESRSSDGWGLGAATGQVEAGEPAEVGMSQEPAPLTTSGLPRRTPRGAAQAEGAGNSRSASDVSREFSEKYNGVHFGQSEPAAPAEAGSAVEDAWNFAADDARRAAEAAVNPQPTSFTEAGLPRRTPKAHLAPGSVNTPPGDEGGRFERDAEHLRSRLASFQSGSQRGRHRAPDEG
ncbi:signal transduction histidine kinase [Saccharopolyspora erythraea NRRL 2338]|uniref:histidine kinase n=2 Tax=Saccharopolyspora erythraea TaxID=1836 RepID=A4F7K8_SACEN|nr:sensor histidine kinase [Saccharopolyspora erythraea]EQD87086.1 histidine kinase [Saccharopolyspora erythraea D]PFG93835.1 signal transduction histidine kinase [Saccharopolyspora erythraea NRRL 2338]QRK90662.1 nitrate- and nitrite sensing domain-containing protein [Saccharopolyspora erythraea]CAM00032.1 putative signal transduction histidine kinase membrane protein [Saccharopolyspora erythraea NRRL 2338]